MLDGIGFFELVLIFVIALLVLGPERLPSCIASFQALRRDLKQATSAMSSQLKHEVQTEQLHTHLKEAEMMFQEEIPEHLVRSVEQLQSSAASVTRPYQNAESKTCNEL